MAPASPPPMRPSSRTVAPSDSAMATADSARSRASGATIGQTSVPGSAPAPVVSASAAVRRASRTSAWRDSSPAITQTEPARQRWPAAPKAEPMIARHCAVEVGVLGHDHRVLRTAQRLHPLAGLGRPGGDQARRAGLPDEGDRVDALVVEDSLDRLAASVNEVDDARREDLLLVDQLAHPGRGPRVTLGRLQDEGVPAGDGVGQEPERDHRREVERCDRGDHADRLADHLDVEAGRDPLERLALEQVGDRRRGLDGLDPAPDLAVGVGQGLAHVGRDERRDLLPVPEQRVAKGQHRARPLLRRHLAPGGLGVAGGAHGRVDVGALPRGGRGPRARPSPGRGRRAPRWRRHRPSVPRCSSEASLPRPRWPCGQTNAGCAAERGVAGTGRAPPPGPAPARWSGR